MGACRLRLLQIFGLGTNRLQLTKQPVVSVLLPKMVVSIYPFEETKLVDYPVRKILWRCVRSKLHKEQKNFEDVLASAFVNQFTDFYETLYEE